MSLLPLPKSAQKWRNSQSLAILLLQPPIKLYKYTTEDLYMYDRLRVLCNNYVYCTRRHLGVLADLLVFLVEGIKFSIEGVYGCVVVRL